MATDFVMQRGAVAMLDLLGFKGIWKRHAPDEVIARMQRLAEMTEHQARSIQDAANTSESNFIEQVRPIFLSDTIVFGLTAKEAARIKRAAAKDLPGFEFEQLTDEHMAGEAVRLVAHLAAVFQRRALLGSPPFTLRGAIAFGDFGMTERFLIGGAVDEAAEWHASPHGAIVMLTPSAAQFEQPSQWWSEYPLMRYDVPLKRRTWDSETPMMAVVPFEESATDGDLCKVCLRTFDNPDPSRADDVAAKKVNTAAFLNAASQLKQDEFTARVEQAQRP